MFSSLALSRHSCATSSLRGSIDSRAASPLPFSSSDSTRPRIFRPWRIIASTDCFCSAVSRALQQQPAVAQQHLQRRAQIMAAHRDDLVLEPVELLEAPVGVRQLLVALDVRQLEVLALALERRVQPRVADGVGQHARHRLGELLLVPAERGARARVAQEQRAQQLVLAHQRLHQDGVHAQRRRCWAAPRPSADRSPPRRSAPAGASPARGAARGSARCRSPAGRARDPPAWPPPCRCAACAPSTSTTEQRSEPVTRPTLSTAMRRISSSSSELVVAWVISRSMPMRSRVRSSLSRRRPARSAASSRGTISSAARMMPSTASFFSASAEARARDTSASTGTLRSCSMLRRPSSISAARLAAAASRMTSGCRLTATCGTPSTSSAMAHSKPLSESRESRASLAARAPITRTRPRSSGDIADSQGTPRHTGKLPRKCMPLATRPSCEQPAPRWPATLALPPGIERVDAQRILGRCASFANLPAARPLACLTPAAALLAATLAHAQA